MTVHYRGTCIPCTRVVCKAACETKYNRSQPRLVMQGFASDVREENGVVVIKI
jgi:hypothetical protein